MKHITALSDIKYLIFGVTLIESLHKTTTIPLTIHYFCMDGETFSILTKLGLRDVVPYPPNVLFNSSNQQLLKLKSTDFRYLCWSLASVFTNYIMQNVSCDSVTYIDSDIEFHKDISLVFDQFGEKDCGIFRHRFVRDDEECPYGKFNVGIVYFKNSSSGRNVLEWWSDAVLYQKYPALATCGDQKYLDEFPKMCPNIYIDSNIGHGAPWNWFKYGLNKLRDGNISFNGQSQPLVFTHFSKFIYSIPNNTFTCTDLIYSGYTNSNAIYKNPDLYAIHASYFERLKEADALIKNAS